MSEATLRAVSRDAPPFRILVSDPLSDAGLERLAEAGDAAVSAPDSGGRAMSRNALLEALPDHDALIVRSATRVDDEALEAGRRLRVVGRAGVGLDNIDVEAATRQGVLVMNTPGANATATAEHTWALLLALCRRVPAADASVKSGGWDRGRFTGVQLHGKTMGIVGLGRVGRLVAQRAQGFGMEVLAYDPYLSYDVAAELRVELVDLDGILAEADVVTLHVPLTEQTRGLLDAGRLAQMKSGALLVNCARGGLVDETAVAAALDEGRLAGAAFDVFDREPPAGSPLLGREDVVLTPHLGASTVEAQRDVSVQIVDQVLAALRHEEYRNAVNLPFVAKGGLAEIRPWLDLAERLGRLVVALAPGRLERVEIEARGPEVAPHAQPLSAALLVGLLTPISSGSVNFVNAAHRAAERGIDVVRSRRASAAEYANLVGCRITADGDEHSAAGTLFHDRPRTVEIDGYHLDAPPVGTALLVWNQDVPGVIGRVGTILGSAGVNIAEWRLGRSAPGETALAFVNLDDPAPPDVLDALTAIDGVRAVRQLCFPG
ncbi:MAG TPA: phosphoglycerate dehydrogenase [Gemmatimonadota bacterium]|nr:phosphoglycerate dehydrogenase [Gemmatimonadota bacterium]